MGGCVGVRVCGWVGGCVEVRMRVEEREPAHTRTHAQHARRTHTFNSSNRRVGVRLVNSASGLHCTSRVVSGSPPSPENLQLTKKKDV